MNDDMELVRNYAAHQSELAFETLVRRYVNLVYSTALRQVRDPHLAQEVTQAVFTILARKADSFGPKTVFPSWLHRTACFAARDALKTQLRRARREQEAYMQSSPNESRPEADDNWNQIAPLLDTALAGLSEKDHQAIVLRFFENKSLGEVGCALGANEDTARMRVNRALEKLRKTFTKRGVASTTAIIAGMISANSVHAAPAALATSISVVGVGKGAAASGSILTLVKGALKIMAWTKAKTAIVVGASVLLTAGTATIIIWNQTRPVQGIPNGWSVISGNVDQWNWANGKINAHSISFDSILASTKKYSDVTLSVVASSTNREASLAIRMQDADNGYVIIYAPYGTPRENAGQIALVKSISGSETTLAAYNGRIFSSMGQSAKITAIAKGPWIEVRLKDVTVLRVKDTTFTSGFIGLRIFGDGDSPCDATFSNLTFH